MLWSADHEDGEIGAVQVYQWQGTSWVALGNKLTGTIADQLYGKSIDLDVQGTRLAVGSPNRQNNNSDAGLVQIYDYDAATGWQEVGQLVSDNLTDHFGEEVNLSADGNRVIIGATEADEAGNDNKGYVRIYEQQGADWVAVSDKIFGIADGDKSPTSIDINATGDVIIIGDKLNDNTATNSGVVRVYEQNAAGNWDLKGTVFDWLTALGEMGADVAISADGNTVAMSAPKANGGEGEIRIYSFDAGAWNLVGSPIIGDGTDQWGKTIDLSADGSRIVLGTNRTFGVGSIGVYELVDGDWQLLTEPVQGNNGGSNFASLSGMTRLSDDGTRIIVGAYWDDEGGHVLERHKSMRSLQVVRIRTS